MTGSERARPGLRKMGWGTTVKKNLVLGGLWEGAKEYTFWDQKTRRGRKIRGDPGKLSSWWDCGRGNTGGYVPVGIASRVPPFLSQTFAPGWSTEGKDTGADFPGGPVVRDPPANAGDAGSSPGLGRSHMLWGN